MMRWTLTTKEEFDENLDRCPPNEHSDGREPTEEELQTIDSHLRYRSAVAAYQLFLSIGQAFEFAEGDVTRE
jgi:hypothetical protein